MATTTRRRPASASESAAVAPLSSGANNTSDPSAPWYNRYGEIVSWRNLPSLVFSPVPYAPAALYYTAASCSAREWGRVFGTWALLAMLALTMNHRYFSHQAFKTSRPWRFVLALVACLGMQYGPLWWSSKHRKHHKHCDLEDDPHSWIRTSFWHSWFGWLHRRDQQQIDVEFLHPSMFVRDGATGKSAVAPELLLVDKLWFAPFVAIHLVLYYYVGQSARDVLVFYTAPSLWIPPPILLFNVMFHPPTTTPTKQGCYALDTIADPLAVFFGEGHHEDHHVFPNRAHRPGPVDVSWWVLIQPMRALGLIWEPHA